MLKTIPLFADLSDDDLAVVKSLLIEKNYPKGSVVIAEGETGDSLFSITSGKVKVCIGDQDGREIILKLLAPGDFFGELSLIDRRPRSASVVTTEASTFQVLSNSNFQRCIERAPKIATKVMEVLVQRLREADRKIGSLGLMDVYGRVAHTLMDLAEEENGRRVVKEKLSQQDIASMVGASREMVNRILKDLAERGSIAMEGRNIIILNEGR
jgi:CRP/FNR family transcriptional regulator, cyclic AMP receptor protein